MYPKYLSYELSGYKRFVLLFLSFFYNIYTNSIVTGGHMLLDQGYIKLVDYLAKDIPKDCLHFNSEVTQIDYQLGESKIKLTVKNGEEHYFDHVIYTGSLGCLKKIHKKLFFPNLSNEKMAAIEKLGFGVVDKIYLMFENGDFFPDDSYVLRFCWRANDCVDDLPEWVQKICCFNVCPTPGMFTIAGM
jgi:hypothetical protein